MKTELRAKRIEKNLKQCELGAMCEMSISHLCQLEHGYIKPCRRTAEKLAVALGTTTDLLFPGITLKCLGE